jgi:hypothetical protein
MWPAFMISQKARFLNVLMKAPVLCDEVVGYSGVLAAASDKQQITLTEQSDEVNFSLTEAGHAAPLELCLSEGRNKNVDREAGEQQTGTDDQRSSNDTNISTSTAN